jgi:arylsulfatase A-like enzyme
VGKTHHEPDVDGMKWLGLSPKEGVGKLIATGGFEEVWRDDGIHPDHNTPHDLAYNEYLRANGFAGKNPWHEWANSGVDEKGELASGWLIRNSHRPARLPEEFSETAYTAKRAIEFITEQGEKPWCLHMSFIKPHWPYIASAPYHMYGRGRVAAGAFRSERSDDANPIPRLQEHPGRCPSPDEVRQNMQPAYMGMVKQIDDHLGRVMSFLEKAGRLNDTMIVFTADHGDYQGDHWQGEKEFMYEQGVRVPLIVVDPSPEAKRGAVSNALVEAVDSADLMDALGLKIPTHIIEGLDPAAARHRGQGARGGVRGLDSRSTRPRASSPAAAGAHGDAAPNAGSWCTLAAISRRYSTRRKTCWPRRSWPRSWCSVARHATAHHLLFD